MTSLHDESTTAIIVANIERLADKIAEAIVEMHEIEIRQTVILAQAGIASPEVFDATMDDIIANMLAGIISGASLALESAGDVEMADDINPINDAVTTHVFPHIKSLILARVAAISASNNEAVASLRKDKE